MGGGIITDELTMADMFAEAFATADTAGIISPAQSYNATCLNGPRCDDFVQFDAHVVYRHLNALENKTGEAPDGIPAAFFKRTALAVSEPLSIIFKTAFVRGECPKVFRLADI